jgi:hypothetical protein
MAPKRRDSECAHYSSCTEVSLVGGRASSGRRDGMKDLCGSYKALSDVIVRRV